MQWRLVAVGMVISTVCAGAVAVQRVQHAQVQAVQQQRQASQDESFEHARMHPTFSRAVLIDVMRFVAQPDPSLECWDFAPTGAAQFAAAAGATSCVQAFVLLHAQVTDPVSYTEPYIPSDAGGWGPVTTVTGCTADWESIASAATTPHPGPRVGTMRLEQQYGQGYLVTGYQPC
jgi:hypothetical protein